MPFCVNCGNDLKNESAFCPNCGQKTKKSKMDKGIVKGLKDGVSNKLKNKVEETIRPKSTSKKNVFKQQKTPANSNQKTTSKSKKLMLYYFLLNIIIYFFSSESEEIAGVLFFSGVIILLYLIRMGNEKPISIILKVLLVLQGILMLSTIIISLEFIGDSFSVILSIPALIALISLAVTLIINGNKTI